MKSLVIQSYRVTQVPDWIKLCLESVQLWAASNGYGYQFVGDEIFDLVPDWYLSKVTNKLPVATDYGRLVLLQQALESGRYDQVIWFDADTLISDQCLSLEFDGTCAFGQEVWVQQDGDRYRVTRNVHNAICIFKQGCPVLPFLIQTVASIIRRVNPERIPPQMVGPKLLTALHNIAGFALLPQVGALSPEVLADIIEGGGGALELLKSKTSVSLQAANLCASLIDDVNAESAIKLILSRGSFY